MKLRVAYSTICEERGDLGIHSFGVLPIEEFAVSDHVHSSGLV